MARRALPPSGRGTGRRRSRAAAIRYRPRRRRQHREEVVGRTPGEDLRQAERGDDRNAVGFARCRRCFGGDLHPPSPHPHPAWPASLAGHPPCSSHSVRPAADRRSSRCASVHYLDWRLADAGLRQDQLHAFGGREVAGDRCRDRPRLLIAGEQQEGRRAAVALDADRVEARLGMGELAIAVRRRPSRRNAGSDRSAAPGPSRFPARDRPGAGPAAPAA